MDRALAARRSMRTPRARRRALIGAGLLVLAVGLAGILLAGGGDHRRATGAPGARAVPAVRSAHGSAPVPALRARAVGTLPSPEQDAAAASTGDGVMLLGGLTAADTSRADVVLLRGGQASPRAPLPAALHDAGAASLAGTVFFFGGGNLGSSADILRVDGTGTSHVAGHLPQGLSDVAVAAVGGTGYVVGGYTGSAPVGTILAWQPGRTAHAVGRLPDPVRYAAVTAVGQLLVIAGGTTPAGASREVYGFDTRTRALRRLGRLPAPTTHAAAATLGSVAYVIGGRGSQPGTPTDRIVAVEPGPGRVGSAGRLPAPTSDLAAVAQSGRILVVGGRGPAGARSAILDLSAPAR